MTDIAFYSSVQNDWVRIRKFVDSARFLAEFGDLESSFVIACRAVQHLVHFLNRLKDSSAQNSSYLDMVLTNHVTQWPQLVQFFDPAKDVYSGSSEEIYDQLKALRKTVSHLERHLKNMVPLKSSAVKTLISYWKPALLVLSVVVGSVYFVNVASSILTRGQGLRGEYFKDKDLIRFAQQRIDKKIEFDWGNSSPLKILASDEFSVRWTGMLKVPESGMVEFSTISDDGVRLWINDQKVIDNWTPHSATTDRASIHLDQGSHRVRLEYFDAKYKATIKLSWKLGSMNKPEIIASRFLSHS